MFFVSLPDFGAVNVIWHLSHGENMAPLELMVLSRVKLYVSLVAVCMP